MIKTLKHKRYPEFRNYEIVTNGLKIEFKTHESYNEQIVKFEDIGFEEQITNYKPSSFLTGLYISIFINILLTLFLFLDDFKNLNSAVLSGVTGAITVAMSIWARQLFKFEKIKLIKGQVNLSFWYFKKYQVEVDSFIENLKQAKREYFRNKFLVELDDEDLYSLKQRLQWLKSMEYVSEGEFQERMSEIENRRKIKGF